MKLKELKEYINAFDENKEFAIVIVDTQKRIVHKLNMVNFISEEPAMILEVEGETQYKPKGWDVPSRPRVKPERYPTEQKTIWEAK